MVDKSKTPQFGNISGALEEKKEYALGFFQSIDDEKNIILGLNVSSGGSVVLYGIGGNFLRTNPGDLLIVMNKMIKFDGFAGCIEDCQQFLEWRQNQSPSEQKKEFLELYLAFRSTLPKKIKRKNLRDKGSK